MTGIHAGHPGPYNDCTEPTCREHRRRYQKHWHVNRARGITRTTDATRTQEHLAELRAAGWSIRSIAGQAGVSPSTVSRVLKGTQTRIARAGETKLLALTPGAQLPDRTTGRGEPFVPRQGTERRIQALIAMGWRHQDMHARSGITTNVTLNQKGNWVTRTTHDTIRALFADLCMTPGPSNASRGRARRLGYAPPLAWDDIDHDVTPGEPAPDPDRDIDTVAVDRRMAGDTTIHLNRAEKVELRARWLRTGRSLEEMTRITGITRPDRYTHTHQEEGTAA